MTTAWVILIYGALVAAGGVMGYVKAHSTTSLVAGGIAGLLLIGAGVAMMRGAYQAGWWLALVIALLLLARFAAASLNNFKLMPGGLNGIFRRIGAVNPSFRVATTFNCIEPLCTIGTFGSTMLSVKGTSSTTATAS